MTTQIDLEGIMLSALSQTAKHKYLRDHLYVESLRKRKKPHRYIEQTGGCQRREVGEKAESGQKVQTSSYKINKSWGYNV